MTDPQAKIFPIFPTPIMTIVYPGDLKKEYEFIINIPYDTRECMFMQNKVVKTGSHFISKNTYLFKDSMELTTLRKFMEKSLATYMEVALSSKEPLTITQSWTNKNPPGTSHHQHTHANSLISGVFYFEDTGKDVPPIQFHKTPDSGFDIHPYKWTDLNSGTTFLPAKAGALFVFPSNLQHSVPMNEGKKIRYSLSFNTFCLGDLGNKKDLSYLNVSKLVKEET